VKIGTQVDYSGRCLRCGKAVTSSGGCDCGQVSSADNYECDQLRAELAEAKAECENIKSIYGVHRIDSLAEELRKERDQLQVKLADAKAQLLHAKASDEHNWKILKECGKILLMPDESHGLLPDKIRIMARRYSSSSFVKVASRCSPCITPAHTS
jgi:hypothetical protein